jgi:hypothetical protein
MRHHNLQVTGSVVVNGLGLATTADLNTYTASADARISTLQAFTASVGTTNTFTASVNSRLSSIETITASNIGRLNAIETITSSNVARLNSIETITSSNIARLNSLEIKTGSLATTGSNTFIGTQTITGSLYISSDLIVQGSSSLQNITASAVSIGTNIINLNTANPAIRYAGLVIGDSGSIGSSGSFLYDSVQDEMIFVHRGANTTVTSSVVLMGPQTFDNIGGETYPTANRIQKGTGNEHLADSCVFDNGTTVCVNANLIGSGNACFSGNVCSTGIQSSDSIIIRKDASVDNRYLQFCNTQVGGYRWDLVTRSTAQGCGFGILNNTTSQYALMFDANNLATFACKIGVAGANATYPLTVYNGSNGTTAAIGGTVYGVRIDNGGTFSTGRSTIYGVDASFYGSYQPLSIEASTLVLQDITGGNVGIGVSTPCNRLHIRSAITGDVTLARFANSPGTGGEGAFIGFETGYAAGLSLIGAKREGAEDDASIIFSPMLNQAACERMRITSGGRIGIGITSPQAQLDVYQCGGNGLRACTALYLRAGNDSNIFCSNQILFGYDGTTNYAHAIKTRHNSNGTCDNAIDFYTWKCGDAISTPAGQYIMTISGNGTLGIGTCTPSTLLDARCSVAENTNGSVLNSHPIATFAVNAAGGGQRGLQFGGPTGGVISPVFLKVFGTGNRFSILNESNCENITVTSGGQVRKPFQPSFQVYRVGADCTISNTAEQRLTFQCIRYDVGSNTSSSGIFTAPLCGRYSFSSTVRYDGASTDTSYLRLFFALNGCSGTPGFTYGHAIAGPGSYSTSYHSMSISAVLNLNAGDTVSVNGGINAGTVGLQFESQFSGYFVG